MRAHASSFVVCSCASLTVAVMLGSQPAAAQTPREIVARAVTAMGGETALRGAGAVQLDFHSATFAIGQEETPESPARATVAYGRIVTDWRGSRRVVTQEVRPVAAAPQRQRRITAGGIGMLETDGRQQPDAPGAVAAAERAMRLSPERLLLTALDNPAALSSVPAKEVRGEPAPGVRFPLGPDTLRLYFDRRTGFLLATEVITDDGVLGDRSTATWYTRWQDAGGIQLPRQVDVTANGRLQSHTVYTAAAVPASVDQQAFVIPDSIASRAQRAPAAPAPPTIVVQLVELAPGVWRAEGGSHHSLVVEQPQQLVVVEGPQTSQRSQAVMDTLRARFPNKRIGLLVSTHHHWDHSGGLRGYLAAGVPVLTHARNVAFVRGISAAQKTVAPDALSRNPRPPDVRAVEDSLTIGEGTSRVVIYRIPTAHVEGMLGAYVPAARLLFVSDVLTPGPTLAPAGSAEVAAAARRWNITVDRVVGGHGGIATWQQIEAAGRN
jgi:glyoxylase-like metal-dependent hydrolase (beta-lactamase superfamily II)